MAFVLYPLTTEKSVAGIEKENKLTFIVDKAANRKQISEEMAKAYAEKIEKVRIIRTADGKKKAIVKFERKGAAADIASKLKIM